MHGCAWLRIIVYGGQPRVRTAMRNLLLVALILTHSVITTEFIHKVIVDFSLLELDNSEFKYSCKSTSRQSRKRRYVHVVNHVKAKHPPGRQKSREKHKVRISEQHLLEMIRKLNITMPNCALDRRTILCLHVSGIQRQVFNSVKTLSA